MILARTNMTEMPKRCEDCTYHYYLKALPITLRAN